MLDLVSGTEEGRELLVTTESPVALEFGAPPDRENPLYSVAVRERHEGHKATRGWFYVDPRTGEVREDDPGGEPLRVNPELARRVLEACR